MNIDRKNSLAVVKHFNRTNISFTQQTCAPIDRDLSPHNELGVKINCICYQFQ